MMAEKTLKNPDLAVFAEKLSREESVALFCHGGFSTFWFAHLLGVPPHIFWSAFTLPHSCISRFF